MDNVCLLGPDQPPLAGDPSAQLLMETTAADADAAPSYADAFPPLQSSQSTDPSAPPTWAPKAPVFRSSTVTQVFSIPHVELRFNDLELGENSELMRKVRQMTKVGAEVELSRSKDQSLHVVVSGKRDVVVDVRRQLHAALQTQAHLEMKIPREHHRFVLGKGGQKLRDLESSTATRILVPRSEDKSDQIKITGTRENIDKARHFIQTISDEQAKLGFERLTIPKIYHPFISVVAEELKAKHSCRINIPPASVQSDDLTVAGEREGVMRAAEEIRQIYENKKQTTTTISIQVGKSQHKYIIGPKGHTLMEILRQTGVSVEMPPSDSTTETVTLRGERAKIGHALTVVYDKASSVLIAEVKAPSWLHRFIIGRQGQNIKKITQDLPKVHVEFNSEKDLITVEGPPDEVEKARDQLETFAQQLIRTMSFEEVKIPQKFHRHIIGKNGQTVGRLKTETGTLITIPPDDTHSDMIRIEGSPEGVKQAKTALLEMATKMENERTEDVRVEHRFHSIIIGSGGEKIRQLRETCNNVQIIFPEQGRRSDFVQVRGPKPDVERACSMLKKMNDDLVAENYTITVPIFRKFHKNIVGRGGAMIRKIRDDTGCRIDMPGSESDSDIITVIGRKDAVEKAKKRILAIQEEQGSMVLVEVDIPHKFHNSIIGRKGKLLASIQEECGGVHIKFPTAKESSNRVSIRGPKDDVEKAKQQLLELADERALNSQMEEVRAKREYHRFLIGRGGANLRQIRDKTGTRIIFPAEGDEDAELITIIGKKEGVQEAKATLEALVKDLERTVEDTMNIPSKYHRHFVQQRGRVLRGISEEFGNVQVSFPRSGSDSEKVTLKGAKDCVAGARQRMLEIISDIDAQVTVKCVIPAEHHRSVMGQRGRNVQQITSECDVQIKFPDRQRQSYAAEAEDGESPAPPAEPDVILVIGKKEDADRACEQLQQLVPIREEVPVPFEYHRFIIGKKGAGVRRLMEQFDVSIQIPAQDDAADYITVAGVADNVASCKEALKEEVEKLDKEKEDRELRSFKLEMHIEPKYHSKIIGRRGGAITQLRDKHGVQFTFPKRGEEESDLIIIQGYEAQCEKARDDILKVVRELEDQVTEEVEVDPRCHSRLIGQRGRNIRKIMDQFHVDIRFPADKSNPQVSVSGAPENVEECCDHLQLLIEEFMQDIVEREEERALMSQYTLAPSRQQENAERSGAASGFVVRGAPWEAKERPLQPSLTDDKEFPTIGSETKPVASSIVWGPRRH